MMEELICWLVTQFTLGNIIAIIAVLVSIATVINSNRNAKSLILNTKLEEITVLFIEIDSYYSKFYDLAKRKKEMLGEQWSEPDEIRYFDEVFHEFKYDELVAIKREIRKLQVLNDAYVEDKDSKAFIYELTHIVIKFYNQIIAKDKEYKFLDMNEMMSPQEYSNTAGLILRRLVNLID